MRGGLRRVWPSMLLALSGCAGCENSHGTDWPPADSPVLEEASGGESEEPQAIQGVLDGLWQSPDSQGHGVVVDSHGRIVVAGYRMTSSTARVWRLNPDLTLDATFAQGGVFTYAGAGFHYLLSVTLAEDGDILAVGSVNNGTTNWDVLVLVLHSDGTVANAFVHHNAAGGNGVDVGRAVTVDAEGRIVVAGTSEGPDSNYYAAVWRFNQNGTSDFTFNGTGFRTTYGSGSILDRAHAVRVNPQGDLFVAGERMLAAIVYSFREDGSPNPSFGPDGVLHLPTPGADKSMAYSIDWTPEGHLVVGGAAHLEGGGSYYDMALWKLTSNGTSVASFGTGGFATFSPCINSYGYAVLSLSSGIYLAGPGFKDSAWKAFLLRVGSDGSPDTAFGDGGQVEIGEPGKSCLAQALARTQTGVVLVGRTGGPRGYGTFVAKVW